jgi:hypothetical protein
MTRIAVELIRKGLFRILPESGYMPTDAWEPAPEAVIAAMGPA